MAVVLAALVLALVGMVGPMAGQRSVVSMSGAPVAATDTAQSRSAATPTDTTDTDDASMWAAGADRASRITGMSVRSDEPEHAVLSAHGYAPHRCGGPAGHPAIDTSAPMPTERTGLLSIALRAAMCAPFDLTSTSVGTPPIDIGRRPPAPHLTTVLRI